MVFPAICGILIILAETAISLFDTGIYEAFFRILSFGSAVVLLILLYFRERRTAVGTSEGREARYKEENLRLESQLDQVLLERRSAEKKIEELQSALEHEKALAGRSVRQNPGADALILLSMLQSKGRLVDFLMEDISGYDDAQVSAAARFVHQGCRSVLREHASIEPVAPRSEGEEIVVEGGYNPLQIKLIGKIGDPPMRGVLLHRGWKTSFLKLPQRAGNGNGHEDGFIISPAEVEVVSNSK